jgi:hypothetical protein
MKGKIKHNDGCKSAPSKRSRLNAKGSPMSVGKGGKTLVIPFGGLCTMSPASEAERKATAAMRFAHEFKALEGGGLQSAMHDGGTHCFLASFLPFSQALGRLVAASAVGVVEHMVHVADELDRMDMIDMPDRRRRKEQNKYMVRALEAYSLDFFTVPVRLTLSRLQPDAGFDDALQVLFKVVEALPEDLSPHAIFADRQLISALMLDHVRDEADRADVVKFVDAYDPFIARSNALGKRESARLGRRAEEHLQAFDPGRIAYSVALATSMTPDGFFGEAA